MDTTLIRYRLERSKEALADAEMLLSCDRLTAAVNRMYYSMFYSVTALLKTRELASSKHSGVRALFNRHFVKTGIVPKEMGKFYEKIFNERKEGDYVDYTEFTSERVKDCFDKCAMYNARLAVIVNGIIEVEEKK
ncbi:MAG: HEPN domain-containing protein [bacterium]